MNVNELIHAGNEARANRDPYHALACYTRAVGLDRNSSAAWNNLGNVWRECGQPEVAIPFLKRAIEIDPGMETAQFNLAVAWLLAGDYENGWRQYNTRWNYEHLKGLLPRFEQPQWRGEDLSNKRIFVLSEQGHGDTIQFVRFCEELKRRGAHVILHCEDTLVKLFSEQNAHLVDEFTTPQTPLPVFDYWIPVMSLAEVLNIRIDTINAPLRYILPDRALVNQWLATLGDKNRLRVGFCWSGRRDTWINGHKSVGFESILDLVGRNPQYEWISLQIDATDEECALLAQRGARILHSEISSFRDTAALLEAADVFVGVDTAVTHLAGAMGRPTWLMLNEFAQDWRWLLHRGDSPWYQSVRIFRQRTMDDWSAPIAQVERFLDYFRV